MAEYIDREALLGKRYNANDISNLPFENMVVDVRDIEEAPTAEVVEVVRCKDCERCFKKRTKRNKQLMLFLYENGRQRISSKCPRFLQLWR